VGVWYLFFENRLITKIELENDDLTCMGKGWHDLYGKGIILLVMERDDLTCIGNRSSDLYFNFDCFGLWEV